MSARTSWAFTHNFTHKTPLQPHPGQWCHLAGAETYPVCDSGHVALILNCQAPSRFGSATRLPPRRRQTLSIHRFPAGLRYKPNIDGRNSRRGGSGQILPFDPKETVNSSHSPMLLPLPIAAGPIFPALDQSSRRVQQSAFEPPSEPSRRRIPRSGGRARATRRTRRRALPA
jgi:hypothetical protein